MSAVFHVDVLITAPLVVVTHVGDGADTEAVALGLDRVDADDR